MIRKTICFVLIYLSFNLSAMQRDQVFLKKSLSKNPPSRAVIIFKKKAVSCSMLELKSTNSSNQTELFNATTLEQIKVLLLKGIDVNHCDDDGNTAFHYYIMTNPFLAQQFLALFITEMSQKLDDLDINLPNKWGVKPLESAVRFGTYDLVKQLLETIKISTLKNHNLFWNYVVLFMPEKIEDILKIFVTEEPQAAILIKIVAAFLAHNRNHALISTIFKKIKRQSLDNLDIAQLLIGVSASALYDMNFFSFFLTQYVYKGGSPQIIIPYTYQQPLSIAAQYNISLVRLLLQKGALVNAVDELFLTTSLMHAASKGTIEIVALLIKAGADLEARDREGRTAVIYATYNTIATLSFLLKKGAHKDASDFSKKTAYRYAFENNNAEGLKLLK